MSYDGIWKTPSEDFMLLNLLPDRTELLNQYCSIYEKNREDAEFIIDRTLEAARADAELRRILFAWLFGQDFDDAEADGYSLYDAACAICGENPDVPTACWLMYLHRQYGMLGILATAGGVCEVSEDILYRREPPFVFRNTGENSWQLTGLLDNGVSDRRVMVDLWCMMEEYPMLLRCCLSAAPDNSLWIAENGKMIRKDGDTDG